MFYLCSVNKENIFWRGVAWLAFFSLKEKGRTVRVRRPGLNFNCCFLCFFIMFVFKKLKPVKRNPDRLFYYLS